MPIRDHAGWPAFAALAQQARITLLSELIGRVLDDPDTAAKAGSAWYCERPFAAEIMIGGARVDVLMTAASPADFAWARAALVGGKLQFQADRLPIHGAETDAWFARHEGGSLIVCDDDGGLAVITSKGSTVWRQTWDIFDGLDEMDQRDFVGGALSAIHDDPEMLRTAAAKWADKDAFVITGNYSQLSFEIRVLADTPELVQKAVSAIRKRGAVRYKCSVREIDGELSKSLTGYFDGGRFIAGKAKLDQGDFAFLLCVDAELHGTSPAPDQDVITAMSREEAQMKAEDAAMDTFETLGLYEQVALIEQTLTQITDDDDTMAEAIEAWTYRQPIILVCHIGEAAFRVFASAQTEMLFHTACQAMDGRTMQWEHGLHDIEGKKLFAVAGRFPGGMLRAGRTVRRGRLIFQIAVAAD